MESTQRISKKTILHFQNLFMALRKAKRITENTTDRNKNIVYLDIDFSISSKGYSRGPHRDRDSRVINFLIYLNNLSKKDGARLKLYNVKKKSTIKKKEISFKTQINTNQRHSPNCR